MKGPERFAAYLLKEPYHPRSNKHSNALLEFLLDDLLQSCARLKNDAASGAVVYELNRQIKVGPADWNVDMAIGPPVTSLGPVQGDSLITRAQPSTFRIACEAKSLMTEHHKAQRNRLRALMRSTNTCTATTRADRRCCNRDQHRRFFSLTTSGRSYGAQQSACPSRDRGEPV
jgi:hypothetical protein